MSTSWRAQGLLEQPILVVAPPQPPAVQVLCTPEGATIGSVHWAPPARGWRWVWPGLRLTVREHLDEPLVFSVRRAWGLQGGHEVIDANDVRVGRVIHGWIWDRFNQRQALQAAPHFLALDGSILAEWLEEAHGQALRFAGALDPFTRMLLLAAVLLDSDVGAASEA